MIKKFALTLLVLLLSINVLAALVTRAAGNNLMPNPSVELLTGSLPTSWSTSKTGNITSAFNYLNTGHTGSHSLQTVVTKRSSGQAEWVPTPVAVVGNTKYTYTDWYQSSAQTTVNVTINRSAGGGTTQTTQTEPISAAWKQSTVTFTTPRNATSVSINHYINKVGQLTTDDFDLEGPAPVAPTVSLTSPATGATVAGTQTLTATATGAAGVQFKVDNINVGAEDTTAPYSVSWNTAGLSNGTHTITATARSASNLTTTATETVNVQNPTAPTVSITAPTANITVNGTALTVSATATDNLGIKNVQFKLDGANLGAAVTTAPYSINWDTTKVTNGNHVLSAVATNTSNLTANATNVTVNVQNPTAPTVSFTAPTANTTVSGTTQAVSATAGDAVGVLGVQFKLDNVNLGAEVTTAPYTVNWDTTTATNATHTLTATARNAAGLTTTATETVTVQNGVVSGSGPNLIANPSFETANGTLPANWLSSNWGTNTSTFSYLNTGHTGTHSVEVQTTSYTNGAANWYYADVPVTPASTYQYTNWYKSNVDTEVDAEVTMTDGTVQYYWLGAVLANTNWTKFTTTFTVPLGAKSMSIYQILAKTGYIISDDYSLNTYTPSPFNRGLVSVSFDDGWTNQYTNAVPLLQKYGITATFNIISGELTDQPDYMTAAQVKSLYTAGDEIASHSVTHPDLTTVTAAQLTQEMSQSQTTLQNLIGVPVTDFAYPFGAYNANTLAAGKLYYQSQRTVNAGYNTKDSLDLSQLKIYEVDSNISQAQVKGWIDGAIAQKTWLILVYHEIAVTPSDPTDALYDTQPSDLDAELAYIKSSGLAAVTVHQAINEVVPQL